MSRDVLLSASLIVRNEEEFLEQCLRSIKEVVDEIVVVDTGSTDRSRDIAAQFGVRLFDFAWSDDFAAARNKALDESHGQWVLYIDADEWVRLASVDRLRELLFDPAFIGHYVLLHPRPHYTPYLEMRLFRNHPRIRFESVIHETIWPSIIRYQEQSGGMIGLSELILVHEGYERNQERKHARNLPLLRKALESQPERIYLWYHLGFTYASLGEDERALEAWESALEIVRKKSSLIHEDSLLYICLAQLKLQKGMDVMPLLEEGLRLFPTHYQMLWLLAKILIERQRFEEAAQLFEYIIESGLDNRGLEYMIAYDRRIFEILSYEPLALCYFRLGRFRESEKYYALAEQCDPSKMECRIKRRLAGDLAKRAGQ